MKRPGFLLILILIISCADPIHAQAVSRYNTFSSSVNEGLLQTTTADIEIDQNNFCWISFPNGIQKFDGYRFVSVPVQPGLPDDKITNFIRCRNGNLLISHSVGISRYNINDGTFTLLYRQPSPSWRAAYLIGEFDGIVYSHDESGTITGFDNNSLAIVHQFKTIFSIDLTSTDQRFLFSENIVDGKIAVKSDSTVYLLDLVNEKVVRQAKIDFVSKSFTLWLKNNHEVMYYDPRTRNALQCWNFETNRNRTIVVEGKDESNFSRCIIFRWGPKMLLSFNNRLYETDSTLQLLRSELVNFQNQPVAGAAAIHRIKEDNFGNLYLQTVNGGIRKVIRNNYPIKHYGSDDPAYNNILAILPDKKNNRVLTGGTGGLFIFDTLQRLIKHIRTVPGIKQNIIPNGILQSSSGDYYIMIAGSDEVLKLKKDLSRITTIGISSALPSQKKGTEYFGNPISNTGQVAIFQSQHKLFGLNFASDLVSEHQFSTAYIIGGIKHGKFIISHGRDELIFLDGNSFSEIKRIPFKDPAGVRCFASDHHGGIYIGSNKGIFEIDTSGSIKRRWDRSTGMPDECIYAIAFDDEESMWCSTNKGIFRINRNNDLFILTKQDGLQENEFNSCVFTKADDGEFFFGGINGVSSFYPGSIKSSDDSARILFTDIKANNEDLNIDMAVHLIKRVNLPYGQNSLAFDFVAMGNYNPDQYIYQYRMEGLDKEWIQSGLQTIRYSLSPGKYTFQVYASRQFDKNAKPMRELIIIIRPPFWKSWWFRLIAILTLFIGLVYFVGERNKRKYAKKLQQLENERQLKEERERISKDLHDSLGVYANAVLYNAETLEKEPSPVKQKELLSELKFVSRDIIVSLRETVWALKKEKYTTEECFVRIRNFIQTLSRSFSTIHFTTAYESDKSIELSHVKALNLVRIAQEAVSNSIKHASPENISVTCRHSEGNWQLTISDDGKGFDYVAMKANERGNGLDNMETRAAESGFELTISSGEGKGTRITITL